MPAIHSQVVGCCWYFPVCSTSGERCGAFPLRVQLHRAEPPNVLLSIRDAARLASVVCAWAAPVIRFQKRGKPFGMPPSSRLPLQPIRRCLGSLTYMGSALGPRASTSPGPIVPRSVQRLQQESPSVCRTEKEACQKASRRTKASIYRPNRISERWGSRPKGAIRVDTKTLSVTIAGTCIAQRPGATQVSLHPCEGARGHRWGIRCR